MVVFLLGATVIFRDQTEQFLATVPQMAGTAAVTTALVAAAFAVGRRPRAPVDRPAPRPWLVAAMAVVAANLFFIRPESWPGVAAGVALVAVTTLVVARWSRRTGAPAGPTPTATHRLALAGGALTAYLWGGFALLAFEGAATTFNLAGQLLLVLGTAALLLAAARTARRASPASIHHA